jgi:hypothetical protein
LASAYADIIGDRKSACNALPVPDFGGSIWKYRCDSSDMDRGQSGGFRILALFDEHENTLYPFCIYTHVDYPNQPPKKDLRKWLKEMLRSTAAVPEPQEEEESVTVMCIVCGVILSEDESSEFRNRCAQHRLPI